MKAGQQLPIFSAENYDSASALDLRKLAGRVVVLQSFATWCAPCKEAIKHYDRVLRKYNELGVEYVLLSFDTDVPTYKKWMLANRALVRASFARVNVTVETAKDEMERLRAGLPSFYVIGRDGKLVVQYSGFLPTWVDNTDLGLEEDMRLIVALRAAGIEI